MDAQATKRFWKIGEIAFDGHSPYLRSGVLGIRTEIEDVALCYERIGHAAPETSCVCGFYASFKAEPLILYARAPYSQLLQIEPGGRTIRSRESLRSERQRVVRVYVNSTCYRCRRPAVAMCTDPERDDESHASRLSDALLACCELCPTAQTWTLDDIAVALGVHVEWSRPEITIILLGAGSFH